jgi:hypothetical protein
MNSNCGCNSYTYNPFNDNVRTQLVANEMSPYPYQYRPKNIGVFQNTFASPEPESKENFEYSKKSNKSAVLALIWDIFIFSFILYLIYWKNASVWLILIPILFFLFPSR